ncbi:MAG: hypothetical protein ACYTG0_33305 [Planctomycetota bacterium]|jgi:hypothetical protein
MVTGVGRSQRFAFVFVTLVASVLVGSLRAGEPPSINPFGPARGEEPPAVNPFGPVRHAREDAIPGYLELSDGKVYPGAVYMTRDKRLKIYDETLKQQREIPLRVVKQIECKVAKEWMEKEWRFKELALNEKFYTGRQYPAREYVHTITLKDDRTITGPLAEIIYVKPYMDPKAAPSEAYRPEAKAERFFLRKRDKGEPGKDLKSLAYVCVIKLGEEALEEGRKKAARPPSRTDTPKGQAARSR